jgi:hypothetical protein
VQQLHRRLHQLVRFLRAHYAHRLVGAQACKFCFGLTVTTTATIPIVRGGRTNMACTGCLAGKIEYKDNQRFQDKGEPLIYCVAAILPFAYCPFYLYYIIFNINNITHLFIY